MASSGPICIHGTKMNYLAILLLDINFMQYRTLNQQHYDCMIFSITILLLVILVSYKNIKFLQFTQGYNREHSQV